MMENLDINNSFPAILGNEEETGMILQYGQKILEPYELVQHLKNYIPSEFKGTDEEFLTNGFRVYPGLAVNNVSALSKNWEILDTNLERATPECKTPEQLALYIRAGELLLRKIAVNFVERDSLNRPDGSKIRIQRRVVDSLGNRKGCHDNYSINLDSQYVAEDIIRHGVILNSVMRSFLMSRVLLTGAGYVEYQNGVYFSQKIGGLVGEVDYGFTGTMARTETSEMYNGIQRFEVRCNDINISDWATTMRIAGVALCLALLENGYSSDLEELVRDEIDLTFLLFKEKANYVNKINFSREGKFYLSKEQKNAASFQQRISELTMSKLADRVDVPRYYYNSAKEIYDYYDDLRKVDAGLADIDILADRVDWAAKFSKIRSKRIESGKQSNSGSIASDIESCALDLRYDNITIEASEGEITRISDGFGIKLRDRGKFKNPIKQNAVERALSTPPANTRATLRGKILSNYLVKSCDWDRVELADSRFDDDVEIFLGPESSELNQTQLRILSNCVKIDK